MVFSGLRGIMIYQFFSQISANNCVFILSVIFVKARADFSYCASIRICKRKNKEERQMNTMSIETQIDVLKNNGFYPEEKVLQLQRNYNSYFQRLDSLKQRMLNMHSSSKKELTGVAFQAALIGGALGFVLALAFGWNAPGILFSVGAGMIGSFLKTIGRNSRANKKNRSIITQKLSEINDFISKEKKVFSEAIKQLSHINDPMALELINAALLEKIRKM